jgi:Calcium binding
MEQWHAREMKYASNELPWRLSSMRTIPANVRWVGITIDGKMKVPFKARCRFARLTSVLKVKEEVEVLGMAPEEECESEMFVWVRRADERIAVPLAQLRPLSKDQETQEAVGDWLYWVDHGYEL